MAEIFMLHPLVLILSRWAMYPKIPMIFLFLPTVEEEVTYRLKSIEEDRLMGVLETLGIK